MSTKQQKSGGKKQATLPKTKAITPEVLPAVGAKQDYSHLPVSEQKAFACKDRIEGAMKSASTAHYDVAMGLLEAYENDYAQVWGFENFVAYGENVLEMKQSQLYKLVNIGKVVRAYKIDREQVERIGWTKMREITAFIEQKPDDASRYLEMAETMSRSKLLEALDGEARLTKQREAKPAILRLSLKLEGEGATLVSSGLELAYEDIGQEDVTLAFQHIAGEWMMARGTTPTVPLESWLEYHQRVYGVRLVRAEAADSIDALLGGGEEVSVEDDDAALAALLSETEDTISSLLK